MSEATITESAIGEQFFAEVARSGFQQRFQLRAFLWEGRSAYQHVEIIDTVSFGRALVLDDALQTTEADEFLYHEPLVQIPLLAHPNPRRVLIVGGGDGGALRHVLMHETVERAVQVEIDELVVTACQEWLPGLAAGAFEHPRAAADHRRRPGVHARRLGAVRRDPGGLHRSGRAGRGADLGGVLPAGGRRALRERDLRDADRLAAADARRARRGRRADAQRLPDRQHLPGPRPELSRACSGRGRPARRRSIRACRVGRRRPGCATTRQTFTGRRSRCPAICRAVPTAAAPKEPPMPLLAPPSEARFWGSGDGTTALGSACSGRRWT